MFYTNVCLTFFIAYTFSYIFFHCKFLKSCFFQKKVKKSVGRGRHEKCRGSAMLLVMPEAINILSESLWVSERGLVNLIFEGNIRTRREPRNSHVF